MAAYAKQLQKYIKSYFNGSKPLSQVIGTPQMFVHLYGDVRNGEKDNGIYNFNFFNNQKHKNFAFGVLNNKAVFENIRQRTKLFVAGVYQSEDVAKHLTSRVPIFYGRNMPELYDVEKTNRLFNCDIDAVLKERDVKPLADVRYAILGPMQIDGQKKYLSGKVYLCSTWGVNYESANTYDAINVNTQKDFKKKSKEIMKLIVGSAKYLSALNPDCKIHLRIPAIGLGSFLTHAADRAAYRSIFCESLINSVLSTDDKIVAHVCFRDIALNSFKTALAKVKDSDKEKFIIDSDLYEINEDYGDCEDHKDDEKESIKDHLHIIVNAWDNQSLLGNGGARDPTIDGFTVAATGPGAKLPNSSYLLQPLFCDNLLNHEEWINVR